MEKIMKNKEILLKKIIIMTDELGKFPKSIKNEEGAALTAALVYEMISIDNLESIDKMVEAFLDATKTVTPHADLLAYCALIYNWLSWGWTDIKGGEAMSKGWADAWYKVNDAIITFLSKSDKTALKTYLEIVD